MSLTAATFLYGFFGIILRYVGYSLPLFYQNWTREVVAVLLLALTYRQWTHIHRKDWPWIIARSLSGIAAFLLFFTAVNAMKISITYFIFYSGLIVGGFILGKLLFHEDVTRLRIASLLLAFLGLGFVYGFSVDAPNPVMMLVAFSAGVFSTVWNILAKKIHHYPGTQITFLDNAFTIPVYLSLSLLMREPQPITLISPVQGASLFIGVLFVITGLLVVRGFKRLDAQLGSLIMLSEVVFATVYSFLFFHEAPSSTAGFGGLLIIFAMMLPEVNWQAVKERFYANRRKIHRC